MTDKSVPPPTPPDAAQGKAMEGEPDLVDQLMAFYQVETVGDLVAMQAAHIKRLQEQNPVREPIFPTSPRHG